MASVIISDVSVTTVDVHVYFIQLVQLCEISVTKHIVGSLLNTSDVMKF